MRTISIVTVSFNDVNGLIRTENTLRIQGEKQGLEWVVVDGGSSDGSVDFLEGSPVVSKYISEPDSGIYDAMNKGTKLATGDFVLYLNSGDELLNADSVALLRKSAREDELTFFGANYICGRSCRYRAPRNFGSIWHSIPANHQAILFSRACLGENPYNSLYKICGDYELLARLSNEGCHARIVDSPVVKFEVGGISTIDTSTLAKEAWVVQKNILRLPLHLRLASLLRRRIAMSANLMIFRLKQRRSVLSALSPESI